MRNILQNLTPNDITNLTTGFPTKYVTHWWDWTIDNPFGHSNLPDPNSDTFLTGMVAFKTIMNKWNGVRPYTLKTPILNPNGFIDGSYQVLDTVITDIIPDIVETGTYWNFQSVSNIWDSLSTLSDQVRGKRKGPVGGMSISKSLMILTNGGSGPAFDSNVVRALNTTTPKTAQQLFDQLSEIKEWIFHFEAHHGKTLVEFLPDDMKLDIEEQQMISPKSYSYLLPVYSGRVFDMIALTIGLQLK